MNTLFSTNQPPKIRVMLISDFCIVQDSIRHLIEQTRDIRVIRSIDFENFNKTDYSKDFDVAVIYFENGKNIEIIEEIQKHFDDVRIVAVIGENESNDQIRAVKMGAAGIVKKEQSFKFLLEAVRQTSKGEVWFNQSLLSRLINQNKPPKKQEQARSGYSVETLTGREIQVVKMIGEGLKNKCIAERMNISEATVRHHLSSIYGKLGVEDRLNLVILAYQKGLIEFSEAGAQVY